MAVPAVPQNLQAQQADGNILLTWNAVVGATSYQVYVSTDSVNYTLLTTVINNIPQYLDVLPGIGVMRYYQITASNTLGASGISDPAQACAAPPSEMSLYELRLRSQQTADRVESQFVTMTEWNAFIRLAMYELYDLLITSYEDYFASQVVYISTNGSQFQYPVPDGATNYLGGTFTGATGTPAQAFYKIAGMDLNVNTSQVTPAWVTLRKFNFIDRNKYIYPNSTSTIYGVYNQAYRLMGQFLEFIPVPAGNQLIRMWYTPRLPALLQDTDLTTLGFSGWLRYVIVRAAKYALDKEESDTTKLDTELLYLKIRIEQAAQNRDAGQPDTISATRREGIYGGSGWGESGGGGQGGF